MRQRFFFSYSEDIRMLKWVVRNEPIKPLGTSIWSYYIETYRSDHTVQSLVGRMRRNVIPNMDFYLKKMKTDEKIALLRIFGQRIDNQKRTVIRNSILVSQDSTNQTRRDQRIPKTVLNCNPISNHDKQWFIEERTNIASHQRSTTKEVVNLHSTKDDQQNNDIIEVELVQTVSKRNNRVFSMNSDFRTEKQAKRTFCPKTWYLEMMPAARQGAISIRNMLCRSNQMNQKRTHFSEGIQLDELFDKMLIVPKNMNAPLISTRSSILKAARMRYHFKMLKELRQLAVNPHVRSAVFMYFQYFEYYISFYVSDILETYAEVMNLLFQVSIKLATL
ncbi:hypothetical protein L3Y34_014503 [Caenorhabditis briggsae]|uniref:Uncharacterized protein n=2 Tax=Caenorhabditis briggsae TaxID=6238 RepID=A0AAE9IYD3_CAEBR|nr:hypothetical protein L3Y34_014503 [Caenorhabditis briggsae]